MAVDRDLGVAFARARFRGRTGTGWEMLAATGVRGLRLLHEGDAFRSMLLTDAHPVAVTLLLENARRYPGAFARRTDAREPAPEGPFGYVDLDPYGSPLPFLDAALTSLTAPGVLAVTATDLMVLAGAQPAACERLYGARPVRGRLGPEGGLRILLAAVARAAERRGRRLRPLLAYVRGHHLRLYASVLPRDANASAAPVGVVHPSSWDGPFLGDGGPFGPLWLGPLFDPETVHALTVPPTAARPRELARLLELFRGEAEVDRPFYYEGNELARRLALRSPPPKAALVRALSEHGYRVAATHARPGGFRTDAPRAVVESAARLLAGG
jgi:tRNA (guanine26-N2/guanine27-N2)-dimethyltransferase